MAHVRAQEVVQDPMWKCNTVGGNIDNPSTTVSVPSSSGALLGYRFE